MQIHQGIGSWQQLVQIVNANYADGSLPAIYISGHGSYGGIQTQAGSGAQPPDPFRGDLIVETLTDQQAQVLRRKLQQDGVIVLLGCSQASGLRAAADRTTGMIRITTYADKTQMLANKIGRAVIGNTGAVFDGNYGAGDWYQFNPRRP